MTAPDPDKLSEKRRLFVKAFTGEAMGNATEAARIAGYAHPNKQGPRLLVKVGVAEALEYARIQDQSESIADRRERKKFLSDTIRGKKEPTAIQLKACELLGKIEGDYTEKVELTGKMKHSGTARVVLSREEAKKKAREKR